MLPKIRPPRTFKWRVTRKDSSLSPLFIASMEADVYDQVCVWVEELLAMPTSARRTIRVLELKTIIDLIVACPGTTIEPSASTSSDAMAA